MFCIILFTSSLKQPSGMCWHHCQAAIKQQKYREVGWITQGCNNNPQTGFIHSGTVYPNAISRTHLCGLHLYLQMNWVFLYKKKKKSQLIHKLCSQMILWTPRKAQNNQIKFAQFGDILLKSSQTAWDVKAKSQNVCILSNTSSRWLKCIVISYLCWGR